jgi:hypothetical protein
MTRTATALTTLLLLTTGVPAARAQAGGAGPGRFEASIGALWMGRQVLGSADAAETTPSAGTVNLFSTSSELATATGLDGRFAFRLLPSLEVDVQGSYGSPDLKVAVSRDSEGAANVTAMETVQQFTIGGGVVWYPASHLIGNRLAPFVGGGIGQLRQMHQDRIRLETGRYVLIGGGVKYFFFSRPAGFFNAFGARVDVHALIRSDGVAFDDDGHASPAVGVSGFVRF